MSISPATNRRKKISTPASVANPKSLYHGRKWGEWVLDIERLVLVFRGQPTMRDASPKPYLAYIGLNEVNLEAVRDCASYLHWIYQPADWGKPDTRRDLVTALKDIFDPQSNFCYGTERGGKRIDNPKDFLRRRFATVGMPA